jgi:small subunit ribosomal protein S20
VVEYQTLAPSVNAFLTSEKNKILWRPYVLRRFVAIKGNPLTKGEEFVVANHKSAEKRTRQSQARRVRNRMNKSRMKTAIRDVNEAVTAGSQENVAEILRKAVSVIAKTAAKGAIHKKNASRRISRLTKKVNAMNAMATAAATEA